MLIDAAVKCISGPTMHQELLQTSHFVTIHVPATPETASMIREEQIKLMQPGAYLINNARGSVVRPSAAIELRKPELG